MIQVLVLDDESELREEVAFYLRARECTVTEAGSIREFRNALVLQDYDIFIIEPHQGRIIYSVAKEVDFATSLIDGARIASSAAIAYDTVGGSTLTNTGTEPVVFDAYVERDDVAQGTHTGARQSAMLDRCYDTSGNIESFVDEPDNPTAIRRSGTFNSIGTGQATLSVGGVRFASSAFDPAARYSPRLPDPDATRLPQRYRVAKVPDALAVSDESTALWGVLGAGSRSGSAVRLFGTSCASPQLARARFDRLE